MKSTPTKILVFGTFDIVHQGHLHFFGQARGLAKNPYLIVSLARDKNVLRIKGRVPRNNEKRRLQQIREISLVNRSVLGGVKNHLPHILRLNPDIIALGYDQQAYVKGLRQALISFGLKPKIVRLKPYKPHKYKTSLLRK